MSAAALSLINHIPQNKARGKPVPSRKSLARCMLLYSWLQNAALRPDESFLFKVSCLLPLQSSPVQLRLKGWNQATYSLPRLSDVVALSCSPCLSAEEHGL